MLSWLTKVWVEDKVRAASLLSGHGWRSVSTALAAVVPVVLVSLYIAAEPVPWNGPLGPNYPGAAALASTVTKVKPEPVLPAPTAVTLPEYWQQGCLLGEAAATPKECVYGDTSHPVLTVALVGDSIAGNWFAPLQKIALQRHWKLVTELHSICPLTSTLMIAPNVGGAYTACHTWGTAVMRDLETSIRPDVVITSSYPGLATVKHPAGGAAAQADIGDGMAGYWAQLRQHGISVIAIKESPDVGLNVPECLSVHSTASVHRAEGQGGPARSAHPVRDAGGAGHGSADRHGLADMRPGHLPAGSRKCPGLSGQSSLDEHVRADHNALLGTGPAQGEQDAVHGLIGPLGL